MAIRSIGREESDFQKWYAKKAKKLNLYPEPYNPKHYYNYKAAWRHGAEPNKEGHWPSKYKTEGHPRLIINGINTKTGERLREKVKKKGLGTK